MKLGRTALEITSQGLGCMSMSEFYGSPVSESDGITLIKTAYNQGVNFFDTADVYGYGRNEALIQKAVTELKKEGVRRADLVIATKCGILRDEHDVTKRGTDNSYEYIVSACDKSLTRLGESVGYIDLFYLHRIANHGAQIDEAMRAMAKLLDAGKIKAVGLSEATPEVIGAANNALLDYTSGSHYLAAVQSEYSLMTRNVEENGVLSICRESGITFVAYSPLSRALLTDKIVDANDFEEGDFRRNLPRFQDENFQHNKKIVEKIKEIAESKKVSVAQIALAWVLHQPGVVPIPGTTKITNLLSNIAANKISLTETEIQLLNIIGQAKGLRYTEEAMRAYGLDAEI